VFAVIADRLGRKRALMGAILMYSIFTAACGFSQTVTQLAIFRVFLGLGMGGEWATGAALVSESFPARIAARRSRSCRARGRSATDSPRWST
jgi:MFS family permease